MATIEGVSGIYAMHNPRTGGFYFGSARNIAQRWRQHRYDLSRGKHANPRLQRAWNRDGAEAWVFIVIAEIPPATVYDTETRLLARLVDHPRCYNINRIASRGRLGRPHTAESKAKMSAASRGKKQSAETIEKRMAHRRGRKMVYKNGANPNIGKPIPADVVARRRATYMAGGPRSTQFQKGHLYRSHELGVAV